jgi:putative membrane protein
MSQTISGPKRGASLAYAGLAAGLALFTALVAYQGVRDVVGTLASAGSGLLWVALFHVVPLTASALGWYTLFGRATRPPLRIFVGARWIAESINHLLPVLNMGGNFVRAQLLARRAPGPVAGASVVVDITLHLSAQFVFTTLGLCLLMAHVESERLVRPVVAGLVVTAGTVVAFLLAQRRGVFGPMTRAITRFLGSSAELSLSSSAEAMDAAIRGFYRHRRRLAVSSVWHLASWILGSGEIWLALRFLGHPVDLATALVIESLGEAVRTAAFPVPGALGVQEGGFLLLGRTFGLTPELSLALSLAKRVREVVAGVPGLIVWQVENASAAVVTRKRAAGGMS